jgi:hypothetical protein
LSEVGADTIRRANDIHPISDLQVEYSLISRGIESEILPACRKLGIGITAYGVLSRGLISGHWSKAREGERGFRGNAPRFQGANLDANLALVEKLRGVAETIGVSVAQVAIAWVAAQGKDIVPLVGGKAARPSHRGPRCDRRETVPRRSCRARACGAPRCCRRRALPGIGARVYGQREKALAGLTFGAFDRNCPCLTVRLPRR